MPDTDLKTLPVLPLKNSVLYPGLMMPLSVGRPASVKALELALGTEEKEIIVVAQKNNTVESPDADDLYTVGTRAVIRKSKRSGPDQNGHDHMEIHVLGTERMVLVK